ncbi:hypothetical protein SAMN05443287_10639 [Micromonospora phaseoli]|uniref:Uncharacterized protein n=1 Tax=Micromonospora phaseoli TaxID=1144548 RepID=A0A1H7AES9_9ACTN|nr:hypothetical protein [Micromonospora phaseoli]PZV96469.1 hypothetical protein CLV64_107349 [Micromonospora phaseoli]GIJ76157.1 hypothetical protein Xph01_05890 [Micromonospora phaseoli]SEJ63054.1 hypothetical protein SAMN05443287_10639 [Micromonospora phaseoli]
MNDILDLPAERDLPPVAARTMHAHLLRMVGGRRPRTVRVRLAAAAAVLLVVTSAVAAIRWNRPDGGDLQILAMGAGELSPSLREAADQCVNWNSREVAAGRAAAEQRIPLSVTDLAVAIERGDRALVVFMNAAGYATCDMRLAGPGQEANGGGATNRWPHGDWLPGPVQRLLLTSTEPGGGDVSVSGRVSGRVDRLLLDHGDGRTTLARLSAGVFGLMTTGAGLTAESGPELVSYDGGGAEIDRRPLFQPEDQLDRCYTGPDGAVIYGRPGPSCLPAEQWQR